MRYNRMTKSGCHPTKLPCIDGKQKSIEGGWKEIGRTEVNA